jgi:hypothetical protein
MKPRRYPPAWTVDEAPESVCVSDGNGQALAFVGQIVKHTNAPLRQLRPRQLLYSAFLKSALLKQSSEPLVSERTSRLMCGPK